MRFLYLHGFASGPQSRKARFFVDKLGEKGLAVQAPTLAPDFPNLTITGQLALLEQAAGGEEVVLIGSSLGGYLAALYAAHHPEVKRLLLLAPAFAFFQLWSAEFGPERMQQWKENGRWPVYHYGEGKRMAVGFQLMQDAETYCGFPDVQQPCLILHGTKDKVVPLRSSMRFIELHPQTSRLEALDSGHELTDVLNEIWNFSQTFLLEAAPNGSRERIT